MSKNPTTPENSEELASQPPFVIHAQYLVDFSFENKIILPYLRGEVDPKFTHEMEWSLAINHLEETNYEVVLHILINGISADKTAYIIEIYYGAVVAINPAYAEHIRPICQVEVPNLLFPNARQIITESVMRATYPPLYPPVIDFRAKFLSDIQSAEA